MEAVSEAYCWGDRGAISSICVDNDTWFYAIGESSKQHRKKNVVYAAHRKEKKYRMDQVEIYFVDAKQCQGIRSSKFFNICIRSLQISLFQACDEDAFASLK